MIFNLCLQSRTPCVKDNQTTLVGMMCIGCAGLRVVAHSGYRGPARRANAAQREEIQGLLTLHHPAPNNFLLDTGNRIKNGSWLAYKGQQETRLSQNGRYDLYLRYLTRKS